MLSMCHPLVVGLPSELILMLPVDLVVISGEFREFVLVFLVFFLLSIALGKFLGVCFHLDGMIWDMKGEIHDGLWPYMVALSYMQLDLFLLLPYMAFNISCLVLK